MTPYSKYKKSGIEWIGEIPKHWEVKKLKYLISNKLEYGANESAEYDDREQPRYIRITDFGDNGLLKNDTFKSLPFEIAKDYFLSEGDILFARSGATVGKTFQFKNYKGQACFAGYLIRANPNSNKILSDFMYYFTKSSSYENWKDSIFVQATIQNIGADKYSQLELPLPPISEQSQIAHYLDRKTAIIDRLIAQKRGLIALLQEEKAAMIQNAVTKGIYTEGVVLKDSGVEWLGEIPIHWEAVKFNHYIKLRHGYQFMNPDFTPEGIKIVKITQLDADGTLNLSAASFIDKDRLNEFESILINKGDILMALTGGTIGKIIQVGKVNEPLLQNYRVGNFFPFNNKIDKKYIFWVLSSEVILKQIFFEVRETGQPNIGKDDFNSMHFCLPPINEQQQIVHHIEAQTLKINNTIGRIEQEVSLLKEYRVALISEAVTGKIDVRDAKN
jgi:type I restriction enzyme, S subunit